MHMLLSEYRGIALPMESGDQSSVHLMDSRRLYQQLICLLHSLLWKEVVISVCVVKASLHIELRMCSARHQLIPHRSWRSYDLLNWQC